LIVVPPLLGGLLLIVVPPLLGGLLLIVVPPFFFDFLTRIQVITLV